MTRRLKIVFILACVAELADLGTRLVSGRYEANPVAARLTDDPVQAILVKLLLLTLAGSAAYAVERWHPRMALVVCSTAIIVGLAGALSNV